jgi:hypothetical protein
MVPGAVWIPGTTCDPDPCKRACCFPDGHCVLLEPGPCVADGGTPWESGSVCDPNPCPTPPVGACCIGHACQCVQMTQADCAAAGGRFKGVGTPCVTSDPLGRLILTCGCKGDCNCDGVITFADINPFVSALTNPSTACCFWNCDIDNNGIIDFNDINPFVAILSAQPLCP